MSVHFRNPFTGEIKVLFTVGECRTTVPSVLNLLINNKYYQVFHHGDEYTYYLYSAHPDERNVRSMCRRNG